MKKTHTLRNETTDNRTYKAVQQRMYIECPFCPPHRGCNRRHSKGRPIYKQRNWKRFRKTQWKNTLVS